MTVAAIVQARMGSSRLPGKVLRDLAGEPLLAHVVDRLRACREVEAIVVATSTATIDDALEAFCRERGIACFRGDEEDVQRRYIEAARASGADVLVRVTGDAPLVHPPLIDALLRKQRETGADYAIGDPDAPCVHEGFEVVTLAALVHSREIQTERRHREHVTLFIRENLGLFRAAFVPVEPRHRRAGFRLSVDDPLDLAFMDYVYRRCWHPPAIVDLDEVLDLLDAHPEVRAINARVTQKPTAVTSRRIGVRLDAGGTIGLGHLTRCHALAWELRERFHCGVTFFSKAPPDVLRRLTDDGFPVHALPGDGDEPGEARALVQGIPDARIDTLVTDLKVPYSLGAMRELREAAGRLVAMDDAGDGRFAADLAVYPVWHADPAILADPRWNGARVLSGPEYVMFRRPGPNAAPRNGPLRRTSLRSRYLRRLRRGGDHAQGPGRAGPARGRRARDGGDRSGVLSPGRPPGRPQGGRRIVRYRERPVRSGVADDRGRSGGLRVRGGRVRTGVFRDSDRGPRPRAAQRRGRRAVRAARDGGVPGPSLGRVRGPDTGRRPAAPGRRPGAGGDAAGRSRPARRPGSVPRGGSDRGALGEGMEAVTCDLCGGAESEVLHANPGFEVQTTRGSLVMDVVNVVCRQCGLVYVSPRMDAEETAAFYAHQFRVDEAAEEAGRDAAVPEIRGARSRKNQVDYILRHWPRGGGGRVLDIGSFEGYFLHLLQREGWSARGVEPSLKASRAARARFGIETFAGMYEDAPFEDSSFDLIAVRHVLEHVRRPTETLLRINRHLADGGRLFLEVPNVYTPIGGKFDDFFTFQHLFNYSPVTIRMYLEKCGFRVYHMETDLPYSAMRLLATKEADLHGQPRVFRVHEDGGTVRRVYACYRDRSDAAVADLVARVNGIVDDCVRHGERIAVFGAGFHTQELLRRTRLREAGVVALIDNDRQKQGQTILGLPVIAPSGIGDAAPDVILISSYAFQDEIYDSLADEQSLGRAVVKLYGEHVAYDSWRDEPPAPDADDADERWDAESIHAADDAGVHAG